MESDSAGVSTSLQDKEEATKKLNEIKQLPQKSVKATIAAELRRKSWNPVFYLRDVVRMPELFGYPYGFGSTDGSGYPNFR